ncbi:MAG: hypothetical protein EP321_15395 [Sphingomonadales bacterium]|nr:MAG: hypothetical protein EP345_18960 [Sphingomonadales bacterium]TNF01926.1 MAG: hypothetical protein EP321_15395 [Sphingomonadales bacterium]
MTSLWLVTNSRSGTTDAKRIASIKQVIADAGLTVMHVIDLAERGLPERNEIARSAPDIIASLGGDGTARAVVNHYGEPSGPALLILPGGTMNLLAKRLHGDREASEIIEKAARAQTTVALPMIEGPDFRSLVGVIAGPAAHWGTVREDIREGDLPALLDSIPTALEQTWEGDRIRIEGQESGHGALFIDPRPDALHIHAIHTDGIGDLASHGWAWLNQDFLGGPTEELAREDQVMLMQESGTITLLVDGERCTCPSPLTVRRRQCPAPFLATLKS